MIVKNDTISNNCQDRPKISYCQQHRGYGIHSKAFGLGILLHVHKNDPGAFPSANIVL